MSSILERAYIIRTEELLVSRIIYSVIIFWTRRIHFERRRKIFLTFLHSRRVRFHDRRENWRRPVRTTDISAHLFVSLPRYKYIYIYIHACARRKIRACFIFLFYGQESHYANSYVPHSSWAIQLRSTRLHSFRAVKMVSGPESNYATSFRPNLIRYPMHFVRLTWVRFLWLHSYLYIRIVLRHVTSYFTYHQLVWSCIIL